MSDHIEHTSVGHALKINIEPSVIVDRYRVHNGVLGVMKYQAEEKEQSIVDRMLYTVERPWEDNASGTAIPNGDYVMYRATFATRGECFGFVGPQEGPYADAVGLWNEPTNIRFACVVHSANWPSQLLGCMALGLRPGADPDEWGVGSSRKAVDIFMNDHAETDVIHVRLQGDF